MLKTAKKLLCRCFDHHIS